MSSEKLFSINYITNLAVNEISGGWSGMNHHVYAQLENSFNINLIKSNPPCFALEKWRSKISRSAGMKGIFPAFSENRLKKIGNEVSGAINKKCALNFFHGSTSWLNVRQTQPYALYLDACFYSYINVYHSPKNFNAGQLNKLFKKETLFLENACAVFFSSKWALNDAQLNYKLSGKNLFVAGLGGGMKENNEKSILKKNYFLFVGLDFRGKGGLHVFHAFKSLQTKYPDIHLKIVGEAPPKEVLNHSGVFYEGLIDKSEETGKIRMQQLYMNAIALLLPTSKDMTPLVLVEAASMGCPSITTGVYGIPEIILGDQTGLIIQADRNVPEQLELAMLYMLENPEQRNDMGFKAKQYIKDHFTWERTGSLITEGIKPYLLSQRIV